MSLQYPAQEKDLFVNNKKQKVRDVDCTLISQNKFRLKIEVLYRIVNSSC